MVGYLDIPIRGVTHRATLAPDGLWDCPTDRYLESDLNRDFQVKDYSPADGSYGWNQLYAAGKRYGVQPVAPPQKPAEPGRVY